MATKQIWFNLPVKDVAKSRDFFTKIGFTLNTNYGNSNHSASFLIGDKKVVMMLFAEATFAMFTQNKITDTKQGTEILFSIDAENKAEVDEMAKKAVDAGGILFAKPADVQGWMYGCAFTDLDGHRWNVVFMDMSKMPK